MSSVKYDKSEIIQKAEHWATRLYNLPASGFLNWGMSNPGAGRFVVDLKLKDTGKWVSIEVHVKQGMIFIPGGALITGRRSLADIHRRFS